MKDLVEEFLIFEGWSCKPTYNILGNPVEDDWQEDQDECINYAQLFTDCQEDDQEDGDDSSADLEDIGEGQDKFLLQAQLFSFRNVDRVCDRQDQCKYRKKNIYSKKDGTA